jgi:O-antigen ligase
LLYIIIGILAWGVFPFGAVHPWAYWTLLMACSVAALYEIASRRTFISPRHWGVSALIIVPVILQLISISQASLRRFAPEHDRFLQQLDFAYPFAGAAHPISVAPENTQLCLLFLLVGALWIATVSSAVQHSIRPTALARRIVWLAVIVATLGLAQNALFNGKIYWFWESRFHFSRNYFGPFVNRNHFAGWMLLALAIGAGEFLGQLATVSPVGKQTLRERILWLGSRRAGTLTTSAMLLVVMAVSLVWTLSRSGIGASTFAICLLGIVAAFRMPGRTRRTVAVVAVFVGLAAVASWKGFDVLTNSYGDTRTFQWRVALWSDSIAPLRDFYKLGSGLDSYGTVMLLYPQSDTSVHSQQAHNDYLQFAIEGGLLVGIPMLFAAGLLIRRMWQRLRQPQDEVTWWVRMGAVAGITGMAIQELTEFSLQIPGVAILFATLIAVAIHEPAAPQPSRRRMHNVA